MYEKLLLVMLLAAARGMPWDQYEVQNPVIPDDEDLFNDDRRVVPDERCPANQTHYLLPHDYDCTKFYYCEYGLRWETPRNCAPGTEFSAELQVCIHPTLANCTLPGSPPPPTESTTPTPTTTTTTTTPAPTTTTTSTTTTTTTTPRPTTTTTTTTPAPTTTTTTTTPAPTTTTTTTTPAPTTTTTITTPAPTTTTTTTTPAPTTTTTTTTPAPTTTTTTPAPTTTTTTTTPAPTTTSTTTTTTPAPTTTTEAPTTPPSCGPITLPNGCPADFTVYQLLPHESNCSRFYYCVRGELAERECPRGTHFNAQLQVCDWPANAGCDPNAGGCDCGDGGGGGGGGGGDGDGGDGGADGGDGGDGDGGDGGADGGDGGDGGGDGGDGGGDGGDGGGDGGCGGGDGDGNGDGDGEVEDIELLPNGCPADFDIHKLLPHDCNCTKFYYCVRGEKVERSCPAGLHFNPTLQVCDWPASAGCESGGGDGGVGPPGSDNRCETGCNVMPWAHETDCDKFWQCDGKTPTLVVCSEGLHFNANTHTCDFICYANCQRTHIQATSLRTGLKLYIPWDRVDHDWVGRYLNIY